MKFLFYLIIILLFITGCSNYEKNNLNTNTSFLQNFTVKGDSMNPTLEHNQEVTVIINSQLYERGDIVIFKFKTITDIYVKRIIGIENDEIIFGVDGNIYLNGERINETYIKSNYSFNKENMNIILSQLKYYENKIPKGYYLLMGDNRYNSIDSSKLGLISKDKLVGKVINKTLN